MFVNIHIVVLWIQQHVAWRMVNVVTGFYYFLSMQSRWRQDFLPTPIWPPESLRHPTPCRHLKVLEVYLYSFIMLALDGVSGEHHAPAALPPEMDSGTLWIGGWVVPEPVLKFWEQKILLSLPGLVGRLTWPSWKIAVKLNVGKSTCHDVTEEQTGCHWQTKQWIVR